MSFTPWVGIDATLTVPVNLQGTGNSPVFGAGTTGDANNRIELDADGRLRGGSGAGGTDTALFRSAALVWQTNGSLDLAGAGQGLRVSEGANGKQGTAVLVAGTVTVANTSVTANSRIFLTSQADGGAVGFLRVSARVAGTSFTITSSSATDTSTVGFEIFEPG